MYVCYKFPTYNTVHRHEAVYSNTMCVCMFVTQVWSKNICCIWMDRVSFYFQNDSDRLTFGIFDYIEDLLLNGFAIYTHRTTVNHVYWHSEYLREANSHLKRCTGQSESREQSVMEYSSKKKYWQLSNSYIHT